MDLRPTLIGTKEIFSHGSRKSEQYVATILLLPRLSLNPGRTGCLQISPCIQIFFPKITVISCYLYCLELLLPASDIIAPFPGHHGKRCWSVSLLKTLRNQRKLSQGYSPQGRHLPPLSVQCFFPHLARAPQVVVGSLSLPLNTLMLRETSAFPYPKMF